MANNPIDTNSFQHFLEIRGVEYEIIEPNNFDQSNFKIIQDDIARDTFLGNEETPLEFTKDYEGETDVYMDNNGVLISHLRSGFYLLSQENKDYGSEADAKYIVKKDGVNFTPFNVDFSKDFETDGETYLNCRVIQNTNQALIKKREDVTIDLLATEDLDDNEIDAIPIQRMLLKAKPIYGLSEWIHSENCNFQGRSFYVDTNPLGIPVWELRTSKLACFSTNTVKEFGVENTLSNLDTEFALGFNDFNEDSGVYIDAEEDLSNITIKLRELNIRARSAYNNAGGSNVTSGSGSAFLVVRYGFASEPFSEMTSIIVHQKDFIFENSAFYQFPNSFDVQIPAIIKGMRIWVYLYATSTATFDEFTDAGEFFANYRVEGTMFNGIMTIEATSTALDSVINAVRKIDLIKQNYKAIGSLPVDAVNWESGGEFHDNFCFNKNLIAQILDKPFNTKLKDVKESLLELCAFPQINNDRIYIGQFEDYYKNIDMGGFLEEPDVESKFVKNDKYLVNLFKYGYEKYEQDRTTKNTLDAIHTDSEWYVQALNSINKKELKNPFIRDPFILEYARRSIFSSDNTSSGDDDNIFEVDVTTLAPGTRREFTRVLTYTVDDEDNLKLLSDNNFSWDLLGFNIGDTITITESSGTNNYLVLEYNATVIKLQGIGFTPSGSGEAVFTIDYPITNVLYTNRTNEGLIFAENLRNSDNFSNLRYSIKRNIKRWFSVLATYGKFIPLKKIKNSYFKANGECTTQFIGEPEPIKENDDILISEISDYKILSQDIYKTIVKCSFSDAVQLVSDIQEVRGFIRVQAPNGSIVKGYIKEANYVLSLDELELELEVKNESDFLTVDFVDGILTINEVGYDEETTDVKNYNIFNDYIQFFDNNSINLCNRTKFDKVLLNGVSYETIEDLINALEVL